MKALDENVKGTVGKANYDFEWIFSIFHRGWLATDFICKLCGKEDTGNHKRDHIEANHLEGLSILCDHLK